MCQWIGARGPPAIDICQNTVWGGLLRSNEGLSEGFPGGAQGLTGVAPNEAQSEILQFLKDVYRKAEGDDMRLAGGADPYYNTILEYYILNGENSSMSAPSF